ncbi:uncharacterized protein LOC143198280 [Rhynchophorus ferrugineus]|uniref:uncharacterized protein LOC143198280 n=1 Tax=Rhynchophorus ferrugineus TaxID=354439 RepID=UPI003FCDE8FF
MDAIQLPETTRVTKRNRYFTIQRKIIDRCIVFIHIIAFVGNMTWHLGDGKMKTPLIFYVSQHYPYFLYLTTFIHMCWFQMAILISIIVLHVVPVVFYKFVFKLEDLVNFIEEYHVTNTNTIIDQAYHRDISTHLIYIHKQHLKFVALLEDFSKNAVVKFIGAILLLIGILLMPIMIFTLTNFPVVSKETDYNNDHSVVVILEFTI